MNTVTPEKLSHIPPTTQAVGDISLDEAEVIGIMRGAVTLYYWPKTRTAYFTFEPVKIMTRDQYTEEWTVAEILKREG